MKKLIADPQHKVVTFADGKQYKGLMADFTIEQSCADCHNRHPNSPKKDFKKGDLIGAIIMRPEQPSRSVSRHETEGDGRAAGLRERPPAPPEPAARCSRFLPACRITLGALAHSVAAAGPS